MIALSVQFIAGRFHGTPWGRHVNEAAPEWPPSPWRLLRALVATWKRKLESELMASDVEPVLRLLSAPPQFVLPPAALGHSRHFMPWFKKGPEDRTLVFDGFVALDPSASVISLWQDTGLGKAQRQVLSRLLENLGFFGRAESWCDAKLLSDDEAASYEVNAMPVAGNWRHDGYEIVRVLCADPETAFEDEHVVMKTEQKTARGNQRDAGTILQPKYDPNWHLCIETAQLHAEGWSDPPGSKWVPYMRRSDCFRSEPARKMASFKVPRPQIARFALDSAVLPLVTDTLPAAEGARFMLMGIHGKLTASTGGLKGKSEVFSGKDAEGHPLTKHGHAYYLPTAENEDGRLDHLTIVAIDGFGPAELKALDRLRELKSRNKQANRYPLRVVLLGLGRLEDYHPFPLGPSTDWVSATPFIATRHLKKRGIKRDPVELWDDAPRFLTLVLREELARWLARKPETSDITVDAIDISPVLDSQGTFRLGPQHLRSIQFKRFRQKQGDDGGRRPAGVFRISFPRPVSGPICLGHSAHFGMGLFVPSWRPNSTPQGERR